MLCLRFNFHVVIFLLSWHIRRRSWLNWTCHQHQTVHKWCSFRSSEHGTEQKKDWLMGKLDLVASYQRLMFIQCGCRHVSYNRRLWLWNDQYNAQRAHTMCVHIYSQMHVSMWVTVLTQHKCQFNGPHAFISCQADYDPMENLVMNKVKRSQW